MATPIINAQCSQTGSNLITVAFQYPTPIQGFDQAMVLLVEQDGAKDSWDVVTNNGHVGGFSVPIQRFLNTSFPGGVNTAGDEDDIGGSGPQGRFKVVPTGPGFITASFLFSPSQPDTDPGNDLEFYGVIAIASVAAGHPVAVLGDLAVTPTIHVAT